MTERLLGWNRAKCDFTLSAPNSKIYGYITREDADRLNAELLAVAGVLSSYEVVADDDALPTSREVMGQPIVETPVHKEISLPFAPQTDNGKLVEDTEYTLEDLYQAFEEEIKTDVERLRNALARQEITTLQGLLSMPLGQLLDMEGVGSGTLGLIHKALKKMEVQW